MPSVARMHHSRNSPWHASTSWQTQRSELCAVAGSAQQSADSLFSQTGLPNTKPDLSHAQHKRLRPRPLQYPVPDQHDSLSLHPRALCQCDLPRQVLLMFLRNALSHRQHARIKACTACRQHSTLWQISNPAQSSSAARSQSSQFDTVGAKETLTYIIEFACMYISLITNVKRHSVLLHMCLPCHFDAPWVVALAGQHLKKFIRMFVLCRYLQL